jgi:nicotinamide-nucleotide amidase
MARDTIVPFKIALLATGDEISQGDIVNTNSKEIAQRLVQAGMAPCMHAIVPDIISEIEDCMRFLLGFHQALIITGGLGPTSDDLTRFALAKVVAKELVFNDPTWQAICTRLKNFGYDIPPDSNRQQALFPEGAIIIANKNGTAAGCYMRLGEQLIFMLPGPPMECLPMIDEHVLPILKTAGFEQLTYRKKWLLFGASEGKIAEELDALAVPFDCVTGYRLWYPYIEFKIHSNNLADFEHLSSLVTEHMQEYLFGDGQAAATTILRERITQSKKLFQIADHATGGALQTSLLTPQTFPHLRFTDTPDKNQGFVIIEGLNEYWQATHTLKTSLKLTFATGETTLEIPLRGKRVLQYATELAAWHIEEFLRQC